ncbi:DUF2207 domain-containing protein [Bacteriovorax sp. Seq25_V]|uniref:DUF2207 domain-containing protein n=1 Tax=Bacteriovorax sp. Seq25_V TaxID=1201288 RepID=UPI00038A1A96|nr:DUF2207 domain-containing protein [Bacteriovorax sp. Seq25_V]EQC46054.1 membrane protein, PF09972 family [Bacteriovorax sp. Seq25_V]
MILAKKLALVLFILFSFNNLAAERISDFDVSIIINADSTITVTEEIEVESEGRNIKRGIYRDLPLIRGKGNGNIVSNAFRILDLRRDGQKEDFHVKSMKNSIRIYFGRKDTFLKNGIHRYRFSYLMNRHINFLDDVGLGELFWNITGDGWKFPIEKSRVAFQLNSSNPKSLNFEVAYTGKYGTRGADFKIVSGNDIVEVETTRTLNPGEGWSVAVRFPIDQVAKLSGPSLVWQDIEVTGIVSKFFLIIAVFFALVFIWYQTGKDPTDKIVIPRFYPPEDISAAGANLIYLYGASKEAISASILSLAVKGFVTISEEGSFYLEKNESHPEVNTLPAEEKVLFETLFESTDRVKISRSSRSTLVKVKIKYDLALKSLKKDIYISNWSYGVLACFIIFFAGYEAFKGFGEEAIGVFVGLIEYAAIGYLLTSTFFKKGIKSKRHKIFVIFPVLFMGFHGGVFASICIGNSYLLIIIFLMLSLSLGIYLALMGRPTKKGYRLHREIEGFKLYLSIAEKDRLDKLNPPKMTVEIFEKYLPYALALGEEVQWSTRFDKEVTEAVRNVRTGHYSSSWYRGSGTSFSSATLIASSLGSSLTSAMASSSSSSSGSSSGGGGGGGGGGGW